MTDHPAQPPGGGSYRRNSDGSLTELVPPTRPNPGKSAHLAAEQRAAPEPATAPAAEPVDPPGRRGRTSTQQEG
jgi:hypothetical protein